MSDSVRPHGRQPTRLRRPWDSPGKNAGVGCHFLLQCMKAKSENEVAQSCPTLHDPMDCSLPGSSIHGIFQARVLEWVPAADEFLLPASSPFVPRQLNMAGDSLWSQVGPQPAGEEAEGPVARPLQCHRYSPRYSSSASLNLCGSPNPSFRGVS